MFSWEKIHRKSLQIANYYGDSKLIRRNIFNTAGSFGHVIGLGRTWKIALKDSLGDRNLIEQLRDLAVSKVRANP